MKAIDKYLQNVRIKKARKYIRKNDMILDIGSDNGVMFEKWRGYIKSGVGIDPALPAVVKTDFYTLLPGYFPATLPGEGSYDVITMLAVLEHIPPAVQVTLAENCFGLLKEKGRVIITAPSPRVDFWLNILMRLKLIDGMSVEEHYGFKPEQTLQLFTGNYFKLLARKKFQFGLNHLFVFEKQEEQQNR